MRLNILSRVGLILILFTFVSACDAFAQSTPASSTPPEQSQLLKSAEAFMRNLFTWGPQYKVKAGPLTPSPSPDFFTVPIEVTINDQSDKGTVYISKDGKTFIRGQIYDTSADPFADTRAKLQKDAAAAPAIGPADAKVTLVEFSDFECPHCLELHNFMGELEAKYPQVRIVYKDFPITQIHPWAETAAIGARCAFQQSPAAFWKVYDTIFKNQDLISTSTVWDNVIQYASDAGLNADAMKSCMASPEVKKAIDDSHSEGVDLGINSTPTVFINGRPVVNVTLDTISEFIDYELAASKK
jgi:protein-disulfide isomerase